MKTYIQPLIIIIFTILTSISCEDVIDVDVQTAPSRLTIEASLDWEKGTMGNEQTIKLSISTPYFDTQTNTAVTNASVKVTNTDSLEEFIFTHQENGIYTTTNFVPVLDNTYSLEVIYNDETYSATEMMVSVTDVVGVYQSKDKGFDSDLLEVNIDFQDPEDEKNFYLFKFQRQGDVLPELEDFDDEFTNGNLINEWYEKEDDDTEENEEFAPGDIVDIHFYGISEDYYNYIRILIEQNDSGGPFGTTPVALKGNCININNPDNYAYGYFRLTQVVKTSYTFSKRYTIFCN